MFYSAETGGFYSLRVHGSTIPESAVEITDQYYQELLTGQQEGKRIVHDEHGWPSLALPPGPTLQSLCDAVDACADKARTTVAGNPLRAVEYERAAAEAQAFAAADYQGEVPRSVAAWAINGRTPRQAADSILAEAAAYTEALYQIRETRLQAKELIRQAMAEGDSARAEDIAAETVAALEAAVQGVGKGAEAT